MTCSEENAGNVKDLLADLLSSLLMESDHVSPELLDLILSGLLPPKADDNPALKQYSPSLLSKHTKQIQQYKADDLDVV